MEGDEQNLKRQKICYTSKGWLGQAERQPSLADGVFKSLSWVLPSFTENENKGTRMWTKAQKRQKIAI